MIFFRRAIFFIIFLFFAGVLNSYGQLNVFIPSGADTIKAAVTILQQQLQRSKTIVFEIKEEQEFNGTGLLATSDKKAREKYAPGLKAMGLEGVLVKKNQGQVLIIGNSQLAVQHGVFILLESLGFRYFMPHPDWQIIPSSYDLYKPFQYAGQPSFEHRRLWYSYGAGTAKATKDYFFWFMANKLGGLLDLSFGHAYNDIVNRNKEAFLKHPDWLSPPIKNGVIPSDPKFNLANEELVRFVLQDVDKRIEDAREKNKPIKMISMSPSDGPNTCNSPACQQLGPVTDRVYSLINRVAKEVAGKYPGTWVGGMAYSDYAPPPTKKLEPNVYVNIATAFNYSKYSTDELISEWSKKAGKVGIYDYLSLYVWDRDMPSRSMATKDDEVGDLIKKYYKDGARAYESETTVGIGKGLGHYIVSRLLWDAGTDANKIKEEFFNLCFKSVSADMKNLWSEWAHYGFTEVRETDLAKWIDLVVAADRKNSDKEVRARLYHVKAYLYYLFLYINNSKKNSEQSLIDLLSFGYRMQDVAAFAGYQSLWEMGRSTSFAGFGYGDPKAKYKLSTEPVAPAELDQMLLQKRKTIKTMEGIKSFTLGKSFKTVNVNEKWKGKEGDGSMDQNAFWMATEFVIQVTQQGANNFMDLAGGFVAGGGSAKPIVVSVYPYRPDRKLEGDALIRYEYNGLMTFEKIKLDKLKPGLYIVRIDDPVKLFKLKFNGSLKYSLLISPSMPLRGTWANQLFIYVPKGVKKFYLQKHQAKFITPTGRVVDLLDQKIKEAEIEVMPGEEGLWKLVYFSTTLYFEGLPPVMGIVADKMLVPE